MLSAELRLINSAGLHARAAGKLVDLAMTFASEIRLSFKDKQVDGKSIMNLMLLAAPVGSVLTLEVTGEDEQEAFASICELINAGFNELDD